MRSTKDCGRITTSWPQMSSRRFFAAAFVIFAFAVSAYAQPARRSPARADPARGSLGESGARLADRIQSGDRKAALAMIAAGADVNQAQPDGTAPLHSAAYRVDVELVAALLKKGARPNAVNKYGASPLAEAVRVAN